MRSDLVGLWWQDAPPVAGRVASRREITRGPVAIPDTGWSPPTSFPNLSQAKVLGIDTETKDPNLEDRGPGWGRHDGNTVGFSIATEDASWYFPLRHEVGPNVANPDQAIAWLRDTVAEQPRNYLFANALYDIGWLKEDGVEFHEDATFRDVQWIEVLLNENAPGVALDKIATRRGFEGKSDEQLNKWSADSWGGNPTRRGQARNYYRCPSQLAGPYAEQDARVLFPIFKQQQQDPLWSDLYPIIDLEHALLPMLVAMRWRGVRVDLERAGQLMERWQTELKGLGSVVDIMHTPSELEIIARKRGLEIERTEDGNPSFVSAWLEQHMPEVHRARKLHKMCGTFIQSYILDSQVNGRLHCQFHPLRGDEYGAISGRFASSNPNLQNIPVRDEEFGPPLRSLFIPEDGCEWVRYDYSQVEFRLLTHFGQGIGAEAARQAYRDDPETDFHQWVAELTGIDRKPAKNINFGLVYGMGIPHMAETLGRTIDDTRALFEQYHERMPFVKETMNVASKRAANRGYVKTLLGRRALFDEFEAVKTNWGVDKPRRSFTHKALNRVLQGSAAEIVKRAMRDIWRTFGVYMVPHLQVHDELDFSMPRDDARVAEIRELMQGAYALSVPLLVDVGTGASWGVCA